MSDATALEADAGPWPRPMATGRRNIWRGFATRRCGHFIDGSRPGLFRRKFEVLDPSTGQVLGRRLAGYGRGHRRPPPSRPRAPFAAWSRTSRRRAAQAAAQDRRRDRGARRRDRVVECSIPASRIRYMSKAALRGAENFRFFADRAPGAHDGLVAADRDAPQLHDAPADRPRGRHHAVEHAVHAVDLEDRAGARGRLHRRAQARRVEPAHRACCWPRSALEAGLPAGRRSTPCTASARTPGKRADRASATSRRSASSARAQTGSAIMAQGAATLKRVHFELGGKNPVIVFADADLDRALDAVLFMIYSLNGERCTSSSRRWSSARSTRSSRNAPPSGCGRSRSAIRSTPRPRSAR